MSNEPAQQCTCDNASGLHWGTCPLNMKGEESSETCANPDCPCVAASIEPPQEWTEGDDGWIIAGNKAWQTVNVEDAQEAVDAHNAALAAERERSKELGEDCDHYYDLLCAEREKLKPLPE